MFQVCVYLQHLRMHCFPQLNCKGSWEPISIISVSLTDTAVQQVKDYFITLTL